MNKKWISLCLIVLILLVLPVTAMAQEFDPYRLGSVSMQLTSQDGKVPMKGAKFSLFHIATVGVNTDGNLNYVFTEDYIDRGLSLEDPDLADKLSTLVAAEIFDCVTITTDAEGKATCTNLPLGMYFVKQTGMVDGFAACTPFFVTVPLETNDTYVYDVNASPKMDIVRLVDITIKKVWNTGSTTNLPTSVSVQLLRGNEVVKTALLTKQNKWTVTYPDMPESDEYSIKEVSVPKGYTATYSKNGFTFTATNTPALAQTGQLVWPIPVLAASGLFFLAMGFVILRKPGKYDA